MRTRLVSLVALAACAALLVACGGSDEPSGTVAGTITLGADQAVTVGDGGGAPAETTEEGGGGAEGDAAAGKAVFTANCAGCHTLADAAAAGAVGPNLDELKPDAARVTAAVTNGKGAMPAFGQLPEADIANVAAYVSSVAGG